MSRLADISEFVDLDIKVVAAMRTDLALGQVSSAQGKGYTLTEAACGALLESVERFCAAHIEPDKIMFGPVRDFPFCTVPLRLLGYDYYSGPLHWLQCNDILNDTCCWIPALEVCFPFHGSELQHVKIRPHTSGIASASDLAESTLFSLFEVIERAATSNFYTHAFEEVTGKVVSDQSIESPRIKALIYRLHEQGYKTLIFHLNAVLPTYHVAILDTQALGPKFVVSGSAAHIYDADALEAALLGAVQGLATVVQGSREDLSRKGAQYEHQALGRQNDFYKACSELIKVNGIENFNERNNISTFNDVRGVEAILGTLIATLKNFGIKCIYRCDITHCEFPFCVTKVIVPQLFDTFVNPYR